jgi:hypothetical protein
MFTRQRYPKKVEDQTLKKKIKPGSHMPVLSLFTAVDVYILSVELLTTNSPRTCAGICEPGLTNQI